ncbi:hypothetical protein YC2023_075941 [Brassica napus]
MVNNEDVSVFHINDGIDIDEGEDDKKETERLSEKTESRGQSPDPKNQELKKTVLNDYRLTEHLSVMGSKSEVARNYKGPRLALRGITKARVLLYEEVARNYKGPRLGLRISLFNMYMRTLTLCTHLHGHPMYAPMYDTMYASVYATVYTIRCNPSLRYIVHTVHFSVQYSVQYGVHPVYTPMYTPMYALVYAPLYAPVYACCTPQITLGVQFMTIGVNAKMYHS